MKQYFFVVLFVATLSVLGAQRARGQIQYHITDLGTLGGPSEVAATAAGATAFVFKDDLSVLRGLVSTIL